MHIPDNPFLVQSKLRQLFEAAPKDAINLGIGQPSEDTPDFVRETAAKIVSDRSINLGYTLNAGILPLREKLAHEFGKGVDASQFCVTAGVQEALYALFYVLLTEGSDCLLPDPGFLTYPSLAGLVKAKPRYYKAFKEENYRFNADAIIQEIRPETQMILVAHPSNPTGSNADAVEIKKLLDFCKNRLEGPIWIVADEVYYGMHYENCAYVSDFWEDYPAMVVLRGASKSHHMTGWRLGWAILPPELAKKYIAAHQYICTCANALGQFILADIWETKEDLDWRAFQNNLYREKRDLIREQLSPHFKLYGGEGAFYWLIEPFTTAIEDDEKLAYDLMLNGKVTTVPGSAFGEQSAGMIRLSYGPSKEKLIEGCNRLVSFMQD